MGCKNISTRVRGPCGYHSPFVWTPNFVEACYRRRGRQLAESNSQRGLPHHGVRPEHVGLWQVVEAPAILLGRKCDRIECIETSLGCDMQNDCRGSKEVKQNKQNNAVDRQGDLLKEKLLAGQ